MEMTELKVGQVLKESDLSGWETVNSNMPQESACGWAKRVAPDRGYHVCGPDHPVDAAICFFLDVAADILDDSGLRQDRSPAWPPGWGLVIQVSQPDASMALAILRRGDKFQLLGKRRG